ncbi:MAG: Gfo/Idh/MocA family oxidoreductase [Gaiella sp.]|nr:Gfo/Idh/MocA family oxidoreductase [Gaiella sp.]
MSGAIRFGILGTGRIARRFAEDLRHVADAELTAVASRGPERADAFADAHGVPLRYPSYESLVADGAVDVVYVATPHLVHCEHMLLCLEAGLPVLCEKPFTMNAREATRVVAEARARGLFAMEAMWTRYVPLVRRVRELVRGGAIGGPRVLAASLGLAPDAEVAGYVRRLEEGGGLLLDAVVYPVSLSFHLLGPPAAATAVAQFHEAGVDDQEAVVLSFERGALATIVASLRAAMPAAFAVYGEEGSIEVAPPLFAPTRATLRRRGGREEELEDRLLGHGLAHEAAEVVRCLREGRTESDGMPLDETVAIMRVLDELRRHVGLRYPFEEEGGT